MDLKHIKETSEGIIKHQYEYKLRKLKEKHNIKSDDDLEYLVSRYYILKGQISALKEMNEYIDDNKLKVK